MWRVGIFVFALGIFAPLNGAASAGQTLPVDPSAKKASANKPTGKLTHNGKLAIVRYVDGEYAKVVRPLPSVKPGFRLKAGQKVDQQDLDAALMRSLPAANPGDTVQITHIKFDSKKIIVEINGGSSPHKSWRQRIHISVGGSIPTTRVVKNQPPGLEKAGATLILEFDGAVPNVSPDQVKKYLSPFLNFAGQRSAAQNWIQTIDPKFRKAIQHRTAVVGMNRDMVLAALGRPAHKVREFKPNGTETEDWIYGRPPGTTIFVTFIGNNVVSVRRFP